jgi:hypothetical protein
MRQQEVLDLFAPFANRLVVSALKPRKLVDQLPRGGTSYAFITLRRPEDDEIAVPANVIVERCHECLHIVGKNDMSWVALMAMRLRPFQLEDSTCVASDDDSALGECGPLEILLQLAESTILNA